jgi:AraC family transcriptional regulator of adaptative response/methylated-DNA-[protein]-cysteine methyltransferase
MNSAQESGQFALVADAIQLLTEACPQTPSLQALSARLGRSQAHLQKTFQRFAGVSPKQFQQLLTREQALERLRAGETVLDTALACGLSGPGRLHDLLITTDAITPGQARRGAGGVAMHYGAGHTPFGPALVAWTDRGISFLAFNGKAIGNPQASDAFSQLRRQWPDAQLEADDAQASVRLQHIFSRPGEQALHIWLRGSPFQLKVWSALMAIPSGCHCSYAKIAEAIGQPGAARATGSAIGQNPVAWLIPCHRVITASGKLGGYRWGMGVKQAMIGLEAARVQRTNAEPAGGA